MTKADLIFKETALKILNEGSSTEGQEVRPRWADGTPAHTKAIFGVTNRYNLQEEFPILTIRNVPFSLCADELLWIWQKKSNNIKDLNSRIWDQWASDEVYYSFAKDTDEDSISIDELRALHPNRDIQNDVNTLAWYEFNDRLFFGADEFAEYLENKELESNLIVNGVLHFKKFRLVVDELIKKDKLRYYNPTKLNDKRFIVNVDKTIGKAYGYQLGVKHLYPEGLFDQVDKVLYDLKHNPNSRSIMTNLFNHKDLMEMGLRPCAYSMTFNVKDGKLNAILNQRSQDFLTANGWNVSQYALLVHLIAQVSDLEVGELLHVISDCHIYDKHEDIVRELLEIEPKKAPKLWVNPEIKDFYDFTLDDFKLVDYDRNMKRYNIEVAE